MPRLLVSLSLLLVPLGSLGCAGSGEPIATYAGGTVTQEEYDSWLALQGSADDPEMRREHITAIAVRETLASRAEAADLDRDPALRFALERLENRLLVAALRRHVADAVEVEEAAVERYLEDHDSERYRPPMIRLVNLMRRVPADADEATREAVREEVAGYRRRVLAGEDFQELAAAVSESETRYRGGQMGAVALDQLSPAVRSAVEELEAGEVSPVLEVDGGFAILRADGWTEERQLTLEEARSRVHGYFARQAEKEAWEAMRRSVSSGTEIEIDEAVVADGTAEQTAVRFGAERLTRGELSQLLAELPRRVAPEEASRPVLRRVIESHVEQKGLAARARELGLAKNDDFQRKWRWRRLELLAKRFLELEIDRRAPAPAAEAIEAAWEKAAGSYIDPEAWRVAVLELPADPDPATRLAEARRLAEAIASSELDFAEAARRHSIHPSAGRGGDLGWRTARQLAGIGPVVLNRVRRLAVEETSEPMRQEDSLWLVRLLARRPQRSMSLLEAAPFIRRELDRENRRELRDSLRREVLEGLDLRLL